MKKSIAILLGWAVLLSASRIFQPGVAVADEDCSRSCADTANACSAKAKDSPNDIDREDCRNANIDCLKKCDETYRQQQEEKAKQESLQDQEQKAIWDYQGLTPEQQQMEKQKQRQLEEDKQEGEREERQRQERERQEQEQERLDKERSNQATQ